MQNLVGIGPVVLEKKVFQVISEVLEKKTKILQQRQQQQRRRTTDKFTRYFGTGELKMSKGVEVVRKSSASASTDIVLYYRRFHRDKDCINRFPIESVHTAQNENFMF